MNLILKKIKFNMGTTSIIAVSTIFVIVWSVLLWEAWNTPVTPDDYDTKNKKKQNENK